MMTDKSLAYLAGVIDVAGYFNIRQRESGGKSFLSFDLRICAPDDIDGLLCQICSNPIRETATRVAVYSRTGCHSILIAVLPFLRSQKGRAELFVSIANGDKDIHHW